jgi:hypothetical protein
LEKKFLSAFVEVTDEKKPVAVLEEKQHSSTPVQTAKEVSATVNEKLKTILTTVP